MQKIIHSVAMLASLAAVAVGLGRDMTVGVILKRMVISYACFFGGGTLLLLALRLVPLLEKKAEVGTARRPLDKRMPR